MARRGRKVTPLLVADSFAIARTIRESVLVLRRWHPTLIPLVVIEQQVTALEGELKALDVALPVEEASGAEAE